MFKISTFKEELAVCSTPKVMKEDSWEVIRKGIKIKGERNKY